MCYVLLLVLVQSFPVFYIVHASVLVANLYSARSRKLQSHRCSFSPIFQINITFKKYEMNYLCSKIKKIWALNQTQQTDEFVQKKSLEQHTAQQKNEKSSGELSSAVLLYAHIRLSRNYFLLPHESWIYLCNSIPKKKK